MFGRKKHKQPAPEIELPAPPSPPPPPPKAKVIAPAPERFRNDDGSFRTENADGSRNLNPDGSIKGR